MFLEMPTTIKLRPMRSAKNRNNEAASSKVDRTNNEVIETDLDAEVKTSEAAKAESAKVP